LQNANILLQAEAAMNSTCSRRFVLSVFVVLAVVILAGCASSMTDSDKMLWNRDSSGSASVRP
jgi:hypothetical protein